MLGIAGVALLVFTVFSIFSKNLAGKKDLTFEDVFENHALIALIVALLSLLFTNFSAPMAVLFFLLLSASQDAKRIVFNLTTEMSENTSKFVTFIPSAIVTLPIIACLVYFSFVGIKVVSAEYTYYQALKAIDANDGVKAYNTLRSAISQNPLVDRYHATLMQVNFGIAQNIATSKNKEKITEEDRTLITNLIQQSIEEGKAYVSLNPTRANSWSLLANLYQSIMAFAQGSDQFAVQSYNQAIALDPIDPTLRISLGGVYYALGNYDLAIDSFKTAVLAKPDLANARYNLAVAYREKGNLESAIAEMTTVLSLVDKDSKDYEVAKKELTDLEAKRPAKQTTTEGETLNSPDKKTTAVEPPINLPEDAQPPVTSPTPVPTLVPTPMPSVTPTPAN